LPYQTLRVKDPGAAGLLSRNCSTCFGKRKKEEKQKKEKKKKKKTKKNGRDGWVVRVDLPIHLLLNTAPIKSFVTEAPHQ
jgi:hypothetical protein